MCNEIQLQSQIENLHERLEEKDEENKQLRKALSDLVDTQEELRQKVEKVKRQLGEIYDFIVEENKREQCDFVTNPNVKIEDLELMMDRIGYIWCQKRRYRNGKDYFGL